MINPNIDPPGAILLNNYLKPNGLSIQEFSALSGIQQKNLQNILLGGRMNHNEINRISAVTRTAPRYWHYAQTAWSFNKYLESRKASKAIEPISLPWRTYSESPGQTLIREFLKPSGKSLRYLERKLNIRYPPLHDVVRGRKAITHRLAARLHVVFDVSTRYWLDLQSYYEIKKDLIPDTAEDKSIEKSLRKFRSNLERRKFDKPDEQKSIIHPGKVLLNQFIKPSGINIKEWRKMFFITAKQLKLILSGNKELSMKMIIKLSRMFSRDIVYWIDLNNKYYSQLADMQYQRLPGKVVHEEPIRIKCQPMAPFEFLENNFLRPMDFPRKRFLRHIRVKRGYGDDFRRIPQINFDLAIKVGQALRIDPLIFLFVQIEYHVHLTDLEKNKKITEKGTF